MTWFYVISRLVSEDRRHHSPTGGFKLGPAHNRW